MNESTHATAVRLARAAPIDPPGRDARAPRRRADRAASRWRPLLAAALCACGIARAADLVVPAYCYPSGAGATASRTFAANAPSVRLTAILNPDSGPGSAADPAYTAAVAALRAAGGKVIAYVHTSYGQRPLSAVTRGIHAREDDFGTPARAGSPDEPDALFRAPPRIAHPARAGLPAVPAAKARRSVRPPSAAVRDGYAGCADV
ncbi:spherulation-specific family 4 protein [Burkholderia alba]|uniref:spherulation-specific family 4 protein n=1 Tax=Burkholderia alba TaxID=2683677 RepID=UPI002B051E68|nr:spherulation-specific family 4 protein [Burkholderia alba]